MLKHNVLTKMDPTISSSAVIDFEKAMLERVVGQDRAVRQLAKVYQVFLAGLASAGRPLANLLFLGGSGTGKTSTIESAAEVLIGKRDAVVKIDCAEFQHSHEVAKITSSPPGYLGHRETKPLITQEILDKYHTDGMKLTFVLFDEIEKAHDTLWQLLLGILDKATLTLGDNQKVDFSKSIIVLTSNLGSRGISTLTEGGLGFVPTTKSQEVLDQDIYKVATEAARNKFSPEFMNRIDRVIVFRNLQRPSLREILFIELSKIQDRIVASGNSMFVFQCEDRACEFLLDEGTDKKYGARHLKRTLERFIVFPLSNLLATKQIQMGDFVRIDLDETGKGLIFQKDPQGAILDTDSIEPATHQDAIMKLASMAINPFG